MANEKKQYWAASDGSIVLFDYNDENDDVEDYISENWGDCEYGEFSSFTDLRNEEEEEWFNQQSFKGTSWNYVLDEAEKHFKCSLNSEMNNKERIIHDCLYKLWNKLKEEEECDIVFHCESCKKAIVRDSEDHDFSKCHEEKWYCVDCPCEEEEEEERYCDNEKCPYEGYCFGEVKEQFEGKPYICEGCVTGKGLQEEEFTQQTFEALSAAIVSEEEKDSARVFLFGKQEAEDKGERIKRLANLPYYKRVRL
jgi:hypothetical protein